MIFIENMKINFSVFGNTYVYLLQGKIDFVQKPWFDQK